VAGHDLQELRQQILETCRQCVALGYFIGTWGNVSARWGDYLLITPTRVAYEAMTPADLVLIDIADGQRVEGTRLPSSEMQLHRAIYRARRDVGAIVHSHSPYASAVACLHKGIPCLLEDMAQLIGEVRCAPYVPGERHVELGVGAVAYLEDSNAVLLANHGPVCCGRDLREAVMVNQVLEKSALAFLWMSAIGQGLQIIPPEHVASERSRYLYRYGTAADGAGDVQAHP
jgi:L-fuculose-phosphate aldolase